MSLTNMSVMATILKDFTSQSAGGTQPVDGMQGLMSVIIISNKAFNDNYEMGQMNISQGASSALLELIFP